jgi:hypothetical protein
MFSHLNELYARKPGMSNGVEPLLSGDWQGKRVEIAPVTDTRTARKGCHRARGLLMFLLTDAARQSLALQGVDLSTSSNGFTTEVG